MELIERISLDKIQYLNSLTEAQLKPYLKKCKNEEDRKKEYNKIKQFCECNLKTKGITKRIYSKPESTPTAVDNRLYSGGSVQSLIKAVRLFCMADTTSDLDMENCHPKILSYICKKNGYLTPCLDFYIANREIILEQFADRNEGKTVFLKALNTDTINKKVSNAFFKKFDKEMKEIQNTITILPCYKDIVDSVPFTKMYNINGSAINRILCSYEDKILASAIHSVNLRNIEVAVLMFDGMMLYGRHPPELLNYIKEEVEKDFEGLNMNWTFKEQDSDIVIPDDFSVPEKVECNKELFMKMSADFEKTHCKIVGKAIYIYENEDRVTIMNKSTIQTAYEHLQCGVNGFNEPASFINMWLGVNPNIRKYDDMDIYPDIEACPKNIYNMWKPFAMEKYSDEYEPNPEGLEFILNHFKILCGNDEIVSDYFIKWTAQMIQYPQIKTTTPTFIGGEGCGKGSYFDLMRVLLGDQKIFQTSDPARDVWGEFNELLQDAFLVNLNELNKKDTLNADGKLKTLISDGKLTINIKGKTRFEMKSFHRIAISTNNENPAESKKGDRRKIIIRCSDEKKGDTEYFNTFHSYLKDVNTMRTLYDYFKNIPNLDTFNEIPLPCTEFQKNIQEGNRSVVDLWLEDFVCNNLGESLVAKTNGELFESFSEWSMNSKIDYKLNKISFGLKLSNGGYGTGIEKKRGSNGGLDKKVINIDILRTKFGV